MYECNYLIIIPTCISYWHLHNFWHSMNNRWTKKFLHWCKLMMFQVQEFTLILHASNWKIDNVFLTRGKNIAEFCAAESDVRCSLDCDHCRSKKRMPACMSPPRAPRRHARRYHRRRQRARARVHSLKRDPPLEWQERPPNHYCRIHVYHAKRPPSQQ